MTAVDNRPQTVMGRVLSLLEPFREYESLTLTELADRAGFPRSSAHRMLSQLVAVGWLRRDGTAYRLGPKLAELGSEARAHDRIYRAAAATMYTLRKRTGMAVQLSVLEGGDLLFLEKIGGRWADAALRTRVGQRIPVRETVEGVAISALCHGGGPVVREHMVRGPAGERACCIAIAFDAGRHELAALSLTGSVGRIPAGAARELALAADCVASKLSS